ncbi:MAG: hypothetical protein KGY99_06800 [Phycisphaerae bacterium]|nr:hypothetical protein [Phycisphaerae bacterium]
MRTYLLVGTLGGLLVAATVGMGGSLSLDETRRDKPAGPRPTFTSHRYTLELAELSARSEIDLAEGGQREYTVELTGSVTIPEGQEDNVIAVTGALAAAAVTDTRRDSILAPVRTRRGRGRRYEDGTFAYLDETSMQVELDETALTRNAYRIDRMTLEARALVARRWDHVRLDATVMTRPKRIAGGLEVRLKELALGRGETLSVEIESKRARGGPNGPFVGTVHVLDDRGHAVAGGKLQTGDPLAEASKLTAEFALPKDAAPASVRLGVVTDYDVKTLRFDVKDLIPR